MELNKPYKVVIADDHILLRDALARLVDSFEQFKITGVAEHGEELIRLIKGTGTPDIIILDQNMPKSNGLHTLVFLIRHCRYSHITVLI